MKGHPATGISCNFQNYPVYFSKLYFLNTASKTDVFNIQLPKLLFSFLGFKIIVFMLNFVLEERTIDGTFWLSSSSVKLLIKYEFIE